jgi:hypothetical protein
MHQLLDALRPLYSLLCGWQLDMQLLQQQQWLAWLQLPAR